MRSSIVKLATPLGLLVAFASCGESDENAAGAGGTAGVAGQASGGSMMTPTPLPDPVACGKQTCRAISLPSGNAVAPCCVDAAEGICGAELALLGPSMGCQPLTQAGTLDSSCPSSMGLVLGGFPLPPFPGCCREDSGQCGVMIDNLGGLLPFAPGCVAGSTQASGPPRACGEGSGAGGAAPEGGSSGGGGAAPGGGTAGDGNGGAGPHPGGSGGNEGGTAGGTQTEGDSGSGGSSGAGGSSGDTSTGDSGSTGEGGAQAAGSSG